MRKVVFLDRDGTINKEVGYLHRIEDFEFIPKAVDAICMLKENQYMVVVVTNQAGVAKGIYEENDVWKLHNYMQSELKKVNTEIDEFCYCPYHPDGIVEKYRKDSIFRKPRIGMFDQIDKCVGVNKRDSWMIGDTATDMQAGLNFGIHNILVSTGYGKKTHEVGTCQYEFYVDDIYEAANIIVNRQNYMEDGNRYENRIKSGSS